MPVWLLSNWKLLAALALAGALYFIGDHNGAVRVTDRYELKIANMFLAAQKEQNRLQGFMNARAADYENTRVDLENRLTISMGELDDERSKNPALTSCRAGPRIMRIYQGLTAGQGGNGANP